MSRKITRRDFINSTLVGAGLEAPWSSRVPCQTLPAA